MKIAVYYNLAFSGAKRTVFEHVKELKLLGHSVDAYSIEPFKSRINFNKCV